MKSGENFLNKVKSAWSDPVWSKVISAGIIGIVSLVFNILTSIVYKTNFYSEFIQFWTFKIDLWIMVIIILCVAFFLLKRSNFKYDSDTLKLDRFLFDKIRFENSMQDLFIEIKGHGFSSRPVHGDRIHTLIEFFELSRQSDFEFLNPKMEQLKKGLLEEFENLDSELKKYIFGANNREYVSIPSEWEYTQPERFIEARDKIRVQEEKLAKMFQAFISEGRRILKI